MRYQQDATRFELSCQVTRSKSSRRWRGQLRLTSDEESAPRLREVGARITCGFPLDNDIVREQHQIRGTRSRLGCETLAGAPHAPSRAGAG